MPSLAQFQHGWADVVQPSEPKNWTEVDDYTYTHLAGSHKGTLLNALQTCTSAHQVGVDQYLRQMSPALSQSLASDAVSRIRSFAVDCRLLSSPEMYKLTMDVDQLNADRPAHTHPTGDSAIWPAA